MEEFDIYNDISRRTDGEIYIGVVGPVRTGKSTFITKFMDALVLPKVDGYEKDRMRDELPQSAEGRTVMTTQPKFVPSEAFTIEVAEKMPVKVRLVDCVGYMVEGANGHMEGDSPRMVKTPWFEESIPFEKAADIGTQKVITEHSTIGIVMTTDGSISTDLGRNPYIPAEERAVGELKSLGKPFVVVLNSRVPDSAETIKLAGELSERYKAAVIPMNVLELSEADVVALFEKVLLEFPLRDVVVNTAKWIQALDSDNPIIKELCQRTEEFASTINKMSDCFRCDSLIEESVYFDGAELSKAELDVGRVVYTVKEKPDLFYKALSEQCGIDIGDEFELMAELSGLVNAKKQYDKLAAALDNAQETGYGVVSPSLDEMKLEEPEIVKQGNRFGVKLKASAPSLHIMRVDIETEVFPVIGTEQQSEDFVKYLLSEFDQNPEKIWETNMFGKSLNALVNEELSGKLAAMPQDTQKKMRRTLSRIVNEGKGGIICILL